MKFLMPKGTFIDLEGVHTQRRPVTRIISTHDYIISLDGRPLKRYRNDGAGHKTVEIYVPFSDPLPKFLDNPILGFWVHERYVSEIKDGERQVK